MIARNHARNTFILAAIFSLMGYPAYAGIIDASSHVAAVTVLADRAIVTREVKARLPAGAQIVVIKNTPSGIDEASLRVEGKGASSLKIGAVEVKHIYLSEAANEAERAKTEALEAKQDERATVEGEIKALQTRSDFITRLVGAGAEKTENAAGAKIDFQPEKWVQAWGLLQTGMNETQKELAAKHIALRKIDVAIQQLNQELAQVRSTRAMERRDVHIHLEAQSETDVVLNVTYQTGGVSWQPVYDARLDTVGGSLALEQYGQVRQQTGEDWSDITLVLSTARPSLSSEMPSLSEWRLEISSPMPVGNMMFGEPDGLKQLKKEKGMQREMKMTAAPKAPPIEQAALQVAADTVSTEYASEFKVPGRVDLKSTTDATKLYINSVKMKTALSARITPRLDPHAYLFVEATNNADFPIIPGAVAKYRDGTFIGNASLPLLRPSEKADLSFGVDDRVKVTYKRVKDDISNPALLVGDITVERQYQTKIHNLHKGDLPITLYEQYPVSGDADIKIDLVDDLTSKDFLRDPDNRPGIILWKSVLKVGEEKTFNLGFKAKYPKGAPVFGL
ncbi:MAG: mucoidy inhibitor MuiA family protein [Alphaproteobacteria bacterium]|nr:mucoidy inhibitor MuiA family protein [Alphaproteobacteria bacterium]